MKILLLLIFIHVFAYSMARAQELATKSEPTATVEAGAAPGKVDDCKDLLPQIESDYKDLEAKFHALNQSIPLSQESYFVSFNQMTEVLLQITQAREEETQRMSQSRDQLRSSLQRFNDLKTEETSKRLQENYLDLTVRVYSSLMDAQKTLENLKTQLAQVETTRSQFANSKQELESLDRQKLAIEAKLISLKIKCQPEKRY